MNATTRIFSLLASTALLSACGAGHIKPYEPKLRTLPDPGANQAETVDRESGSIYNGSGSGSLFTGLRAHRLNDIVVVRIEEAASAQRNSQTQLGRAGGLSLGGDAFGLVEKALPGVNSDEVIRGGSETSFDGSGRTSRRDEVRFTVAATVTQVFANGHLVVQGHRVVLVNGEEHHFTVSGVARPADILVDNSISSTLLADAEIEFTGRGTISDTQEPGWLTRFINFISPF